MGDGRAGKQVRCCAYEAEDVAKSYGGSGRSVTIAQQNRKERDVLIAMKAIVTVSGKGRLSTLGNLQLVDCARRVSPPHGHGSYVNDCSVIQNTAL